MTPTKTELITLGILAFVLSVIIATLPAHVDSQAPTKPGVVQSFYLPEKSPVSVPGVVLVSPIGGELQGN